MRWAFAVAALLWAASTDASVVSRSHASLEGFEFLGSFVYNYLPGNSTTKVPGVFDITLRANFPPADARLYLYTDQEGSWPDVYKSSLSCEEKLKRARNPRGIEVKWGLDNTFTHRESIRQHVRPRYWFVVLSNCHRNVTGWGTVHSTIHFLNINDGDWSMEFGVNEQGMNTLYILGFVVWLVIMGLQCFSIYKLRQKLSFVHPLVKLFTVVCLAEFISVLFKMIHYASFTKDGKGHPAVNHLGDIADSVSQILFMLLLLLLAQGWTISGDRLRGRLLIVASVVLFMGAQIAMLVWKFAEEDPASPETAPLLFGFLMTLTAVWALFAVWYEVSVWRSWWGEVNPVKRKLYLTLGVLYTPFMAGLPFVVFLVLALDPWVREKFIATAEVLITAVACSVMAFLLWPSRAADYFEIEKPTTSLQGGSLYEQL